MKKIADGLFLFCTIYFLFMAIAHFFGLKYPLLFIYYDVPFYAYQDRIISFAVVAYVALFFEAFRKPSVRPSAIAVMFITYLGLTAVNNSQGLQDVMEAHQSTMPYWIQTTLILLIAISLAVSHLFSTDNKDRRSKRTN